MQWQYELDLHKIPATPDSPPEQSISFSSEYVPIGTYSSDKTHILSLYDKPESGEVLRKSSKFILEFLHKRRSALRTA